MRFFQEILGLKYKNSEYMILMMKNWIEKGMCQWCIKKITFLWGLLRNIYMKIVKAMKLNCLNA